MERGFWGKLDKPIIGLSPMDGITDSGYRFIVAKYGKPSVMVTEFTNVEGLTRGARKMMTAFLYDNTERPVVGQIYGVEVESFYKATVMLCALGFDGVDINMGCPATKVANRGSGAGLIRTPDLAKEIIRACKRATKDFANGITMKEAGVHENIVDEVETILTLRGQNLSDFAGRAVPVSVKTRIGYDLPIVEEWMKHLIEEQPANITLHGRTLKQMYMGLANWEEIARAGKVVKGAGIGFLGNGDVKDLKDAYEKIERYGVDGVLIGRSAFGNPWIFKGHQATVREKLEVLLEHVRFVKNEGISPFCNIKKHLGWYCVGFDGAKELRKQMMACDKFDQVEKIVEEYLSTSNFDLQPL